MGTHRFNVFCKPKNQKGDGQWLSGARGSALCSVQAGEAGNGPIFDFYIFSPVRKELRNPDPMLTHSFILHPALSLLQLSGGPLLLLLCPHFSAPTLVHSVYQPHPALHLSAPGKCTTPHPPVRTGNRALGPALTLRGHLSF